MSNLYDFLSASNAGVPLATRTHSCCSRSAVAPTLCPQSVGIMFGVYAATSLDGLYISKSMEAMGVDSSKALFWAVVQLATVAAIFF